TAGPEERSRTESARQHMPRRARENSRPDHCTSRLVNDECRMTNAVNDEWWNGERGRDSGGTFALLRPARPRLTDAVGHVEGGEHAERLGVRDELIAPVFERLDALAEIGDVPFVDHHLGPVLDEDVPGLHGEVAKK